MQLLSRQEYNLILRSFDKYDVYMNTKERELREQLEEKLYNNFYNPQNNVAQTHTELPDLDINLSALYDIQTEKDLSEDDEIKELNFTH